MRYFLLCILTPLSLWAQSDSFQFSADSTKVLFSSGREFTELSGNAEVISGDIRLKADSIRLYGPEFRFMECIGNVIFRDEEKKLFLNAQSISYDRETKRATAIGQVILEDGKESLVARSSALDISEDSAVILFKAGVRIFRDDLLIRAELVQFQREDGWLRLRGFPIVYWGEDEYRAMFIELNIDTEEVNLIGGVSGAIVPEKENPPETGSNLPPSETETPEEERDEPLPEAEGDVQQ